MSEYVVSCDALELPKGSYFIVLPGVEVAPGQLCLFNLEGREIVGRHYYDGEIQLPGRRILTGGLSCRVVGPVVPVELTARTITNLPESEYGRFLEKPFPQTLGS